jgi:hypothetical protein
MLAEPEHYKGILYIRISALPGEQKNSIRSTYNRDSIIKILKEDALINDCILYDDYLNWYKDFSNARVPKSKTSNSMALVKAEIPVQ